MMPALCAGLCALLTSQVELRRGAAPIPDGAVVTAVSAAGVTVAMPATEPGGSGRTIVLGWDRVRSVGGDHAGEAKQFAELADKAWRASARLERGDFVAAEPILDELFGAVRGMQGPTPALVCEGLLKCRLRRGAQMGAVEAWLAAMSSRPAGTEGSEASTRSEAGVIDPVTGLAPPLPPVWIGMPSLQVWAAGPPRFEAGTRAGVMEAMYRESAKFECGLPVAIPDAPTDDAAARLVWEVVTARAGDAAKRKSARDALNARMAGSIPTWQEAWCRAGVGRSLLKDDSPETRRLGAVQLLHVPARLADDNPYLAGIGLAEAAVELKKQGDEAGAQRLRAELTTRYPDHPALQWDALRGWAAPKAPAAKDASPKDAAPKDGVKETTIRSGTGGPAGANPEPVAPK